jgi:CBS domain-containing protein
MERSTAPLPPVGAVMRLVPTLHPEDTILKAAGLLRRSSLGAVPVVEGGRLLGMVGEATLRGVEGNGAATRPVREVMQGLVTAVPNYVGLDVAVQVFEAGHADVMPVVDHGGHYRGMVARSDLVQGMAGVVPPPRIGGMATPLGGDLTSGVVRGGVGDFALFLAGTALFLCMALASAVVFAIAWYVKPGAAMDLLFLGPTAELPWAWIAVATVIAILFRTSPLAAFHAAEHQVVNAIERGEDLTVAKVARMPRVHPRCGTNLVVVGVTATAVVTLLGGGADVVIVAVLVGLVARYALGAVVQQYITTKPASEHELRSGLRAAEQLLERHQQAIGRVPTLFSRIWCMGLVQVAAGLMAPMWLASRVASLFGVYLPF